MKYVLICVIVAAGALLGNTFISMEKKRAAVLASLITAAGRINSSMSKQGCMLKTALLRSEGEDKGVFYICAKLLSCEQGKLTLDALVEKSGTDKDVCAAVIAYIEALSSSAADCQIEGATQVFLTETERMLKDTQETRLKKAGTIRNLCVFSAIALGIILI